MLGRRPPFVDVRCEEVRVSNLLATREYRHEGEEKRLEVGLTSIRALGFRVCSNPEFTPSSSPTTSLYNYPSQSLDTTPQPYISPTSCNNNLNQPQECTSPHSSSPLVASPTHSPPPFPTSNAMIIPHA